MSDKQPGLLSLILIPAIVTLCVSVVRLVGELQGWDPVFFGKDAPGTENASPGYVGIAWMVPLFGIYFGARLRRTTGQPQHAGKAALTFLIAAVVLIGGFAACILLDLVSMPNAEEPGEPRGLVYAMSCIAAAIVVMLLGAGRLAVVLLVYGLLARLPIVAITWLAIDSEWDTHHVKLPVGTVLPEGTDAFTFLATPQLTFWIAFTMLFGGLFGCLGAALFKKS